MYSLLATFIILHYVVDFSYSMLLGRPWLQDANVAHDSNNNMVTRKWKSQNHCNNKHLGSDVKQHDVLLCYDFQNGITN